MRTTLTTGTNFDQVAQRDTNQTTGRRWLHNVGESISLYVAGSKAAIKETLKLIAAKGKIQMQAQSGEIEATAEQAMKITSVSASQLWAGQTDITFVCGGAYVKISNGNIEIHAPKNVSLKGAQVPVAGPASMGVQMPEFPISEPAKHSLRWKVVSAVDGRPAKGMDTISMLPSNEVIQSALTGGDGRSDREFAPTGLENRVALLGSGDWVIDVDSDLDPVPMDRDDDDEEEDIA